MIRQHSQAIRQPERPETLLGRKLREAMERKARGVENAGT